MDAAKLRALQAPIKIRRKINGMVNSKINSFGRGSDGSTARISRMTAVTVTPSLLSSTGSP